MHTGKFNCMVPGTLFANTAKCPASSSTGSDATPPVPVTSSSYSTVVNTASETSSKFDNLLRFDIGSVLFYVVVGAGSVMVITLTLCLMGLCATLCYKKRCKRKFIQTMA